MAGIVGWVEKLNLLPQIFKNLDFSIALKLAQKKQGAKISAF
jgi:hypothetical protein